MQKWTAQQQAAIDEHSGNLLISASAGSGKTSVMVQRVIADIVAKRLSLDRVLMVTFTESAASEMKQRIFTALSTAAEKQTDLEYLKKQTDLVDTAEISTLHSFCKKLIKQHFYEVGVDADVCVLSDQDAAVMKRQAMQETVEQLLSTDDEAFVQLFDIYSPHRRESDFYCLIEKIYQFVMASANPKQMITNGLTSGYRNFDQVFTRVQEIFHLRCADYLEQCQSLAHTCKSNQLVAQAANLLQIADYLKNLQAQLQPLPFMRQLTEPLALSRTRIDKDADTEQIRQNDAYKLLKEIVLNQFIKKFADVFCESAYQAQANSVETICAHINQLGKTVALFTENFKKLKAKANVIDFSDMEHFALQILQNAEIAQAVTKRYDAVFIDEYQDISDVQEAILTRLSSTDNRFMVGDVKQSIYAFRMCNCKNFTDKIALYAQKEYGQVLRLNHNFRSDNGILQFVNDVFSPIFTRQFGGSNYLEEGAFVVEPTTSTVQPSVYIGCVEAPDKLDKPVASLQEVYSMDDAEPLDESAAYEAQWIFEQIEKITKNGLIDTDSKKESPVRFGDIVLLARDKGAYTRSVQRYLIAKGLPVVSEMEQKAGDEVELLIHLLRVIDNPKNDVPLLAVMRSVFGGFSDEELSDIRVQAPSTCKFFHECVTHAGQAKGSAAKKIQKFFDWLTHANQRLACVSIAELLTDLILHSKYRLELAQKHNGSTRLKMVERFLNGLQLSAYAHNITGFLQQACVETVMLGDTYSASGESISMMTVHRSKGLEFPIVFLVGCHRHFHRLDNNPLVVIDRDFGLGVNQYSVADRTKETTMLKNALKMIADKQTAEEEMRIFYVALTRAKNRLYISARMQNAEMQSRFGLDAFAKPIILSQSYLDFLTPALKNYLQHSKNYVAINCIVAKDKPPLVSRQQPILATTSSKQDVLEIQRVLSYTYPYSNIDKQRQKYTVTHMLDDESSVQPPAPLLLQQAAEVGTNYHAILQHVDLLDTRIDKIEQTVKLLRERKLVTQQDVDLQAIKRCLDSRIFDLARKNRCYREQAFMLYVPARDLNLPGEGKVLLQGKIDLMIVTDTGAVICDFKSGTISSTQQAKARYARQLELYAYAVEQVLHLHVLQKAVFSMANGKLFYI